MLYEGVVATARIVDLGVRRSVPGAAIADRVLPSVAKCANAFITHHGLQKRLWRHPNNPIDPRKFPSGWCKSTPRGRPPALHFFAHANPAMRSGCTVATRAECADRWRRPKRLAGRGGSGARLSEHAQPRSPESSCAD